METIQYQKTKIFIGEKHQNLSDYLPKKAGKCILLIDENVFTQDVYDFSAFDHVIVPSGENSKSLNMVELLVNQLLDMGLDRSGFLVGVGGGVVCDLTGFVASIFMRGISFGFVPTTLLAQVDASIGGKNGVNLGLYKNMIGTFQQPEFILIDLDFLKTLPQNEFIGGMTEVIKHACILNPAYFELLESNAEKIMEQDSDLVYKVVMESVKIKTRIVEADERESGLRKMLNYGHTFGHAIEKVKGISHGEAVSLGIITVNKIALACNRLHENEAIRVSNLLAKFGLPTNMKNIDYRELRHIVLKDKKRTISGLDLILLNKIGNAEIVTLSTDEIDALFHHG